MSYLTESEIPLYCGLVSGVTMDHVEAATTLIDAYKGASFLPQTYVERSEIKWKLDEFRGKLNHFPRITIDKIIANVKSVFGEQKIELPVECLDFDIIVITHLPTHNAAHLLDITSKHPTGTLELFRDFIVSAGVSHLQLLRNFAEH